jgi:hypothetical protein
MIQNGIIINSDLNIINGFLDCSITIKLEEGGVQKLEGGCLYMPETYRNHNIRSFAGHWIYNIMKIAGVNRWNEVVGKSIRVSNTPYRIDGIGHIIESIWFYPNRDFNVEDADK